MNHYRRQAGDTASDAGTTAMTDHGRKYGGLGGLGGGGRGDINWQVAEPASGRQPRKPNNKKFTAFRKFGGGRPESGPDDRTASRCHYEPVRHADETRDAVQWESMTKHFSRLPPFIDDNVDKFKNGNPRTNIPQYHHLHYYRDLHQLHQVAYATRNSSIGRNPQQPCCKPLKWNPFGGPTGTYMNAFYLSEPGRYATHAKKVICDDSLVEMDETDELSSAIWRRYLDNRQSEDVYNTKLTMWCTLSALIKSRAPGCGLYLVGSTMNGFGGDVSDADFCLLTGCTAAASAAVSVGGGQHQRAIAAAADERHRSCGVERLQWLMALLGRERLDDDVAIVDPHIVYAKVPILRFWWVKDNARVDVDLCCNNVVGIRNTHLLYCYSRLDYRVRPLVLTVKLWASYHNINDPKKMTLSSYSLVLMVINFLQCIQPPVLPSLQCIYGMKFSAETNIEFVHMHEQLPRSSWKSDNQQTLSELLLQFFEHYNNFNYYMNAVSVRTGRQIPLEHCRMALTIKNDPGQWKFIGIEEPFERTNTARSVHNHNIFEQIKEVIRKSYNKLKETKSLDSIFCQFEK
ncbi:PAP/25A-associated [Cinara cedri]|uniref:PAP/25A-associated n=1 Tax=Cinara cedri TaxID=506608 RepID=A0A5E4MYN5_9HEMI|nr:PAP/25A-associated [Cinara cedri]